MNLQLSYQNIEPIIVDFINIPGENEEITFNRVEKLIRSKYNDKVNIYTFISRNYENTILKSHIVGFK